MATGNYNLYIDLIFCIISDTGIFLVVIHIDNMRYALYTIHCTMCNIHCIITYIVHCTIIHYVKHQLYTVILLYCETSTIHGKTLHYIVSNCVHI